MKYSRQREALLENLKNRCDHPTADVLYQSLREEFPRVSLGTVYRNLSLLCRTGDIRRITCGDGVERYDFNTDEHIHFVCTACSKVQDVHAELDRTIDAAVRSEKIGKVNSHSLILYGYCSECLKKNKKNIYKEKEN